MEFPVIESERIRLRKGREDDLEPMFNNVWSQPDLAKMMLWKPLTTIEEAKIRIEKTIEFQKTHYSYYICLKDTDEPIGFCGVIKTDEGIYEDIGLCITTKYQHMGLGNEALSCLEKLVFEYLKGKRFVYTTFSTNKISQKLCLSHGFEYLNTVKKYRDYDKLKYDLDIFYKDNPAN